MINRTEFRSQSTTSHFIMLKVTTYNKAITGNSLCSPNGIVMLFVNRWKETKEKTYRLIREDLTDTTQSKSDDPEEPVCTPIASGVAGQARGLASDFRHLVGMNLTPADGTFPEHVSPPLFPPQKACIQTPAGAHLASAGVQPPTQGSGSLYG